MLAWNDSSFHVDIKRITNQLIHCNVKSTTGQHDFACTFVYAHNSSNLRERLWRDMEEIG